MKRILLFLTINLGFFCGNAQTIGLKYSPNITITSNNQYRLGFGFSSGLYYDQRIHKRLGISTGVMITRFRESHPPDACLLCLDCCPYRIDNRFDILEIPLDLTTDFSMNPDSKWKFFLTSGYSFGQIIRNQQFNHYISKQSSQKITTPHGIIPRHFFKLGFELRHNFSDEINFACGGQYKYTSINEEVVKIYI